jgi:hypothetical protein
MGSKPISPIYAIVEKAYYRLQAGDVLSHCLEDGSTEPIHTMIQEMVVDGPQNLEALREILSETEKRKSQVHDDLSQVINQLGIIMQGYGLNLEGLGSNHGLVKVNENQLVNMMDDQQIFDSDTRTDCLQVMVDSEELMNTLNSKILLLENIENYLKDWLMGLTYQSIKRGEEETGNPNPQNELL